MSTSMSPTPTWSTPRSPSPPRTAPSRPTAPGAGAQRRCPPPTPPRRRRCSTRSTPPMGTPRPAAPGRPASRRRAPAVGRALALLQELPGSTLSEALAREAAALEELVRSDGAAASMYSAEMLRRGRPGRTPVDGAREIRRVGVAGAGLMASQIAAQLALGLQVPVVMRDLDAETAAKGLAAARDVIAPGRRARSARRGRRHRDRREPLRDRGPAGPRRLRPRASRPCPRCSRSRSRCSLSSRACWRRTPCWSPTPPRSR